MVSWLFIVINGHLLIIAGSGETNTHIEITEGLVDRLIALGKRFDYFVYPNRDHGLSEGVGSSVHVRMLIARYLIEHLPPGPSCWCWQATLALIKPDRL